MISPDRMLAQQQIYNFLRSVTIKFSPLAAHYINTTLLQKGYSVDPNDESTWKYYLNMIGEYHVSDTVMYVTSIDTHERIMFSPQVLKDHPRTREAYVPGGVFYDRLCQTYPDQVDLVKSILFPVESMEKALLSEDLTLLAYGEGYLEDYEEPIMIAKIEEFLTIVKERWYFDFLDDEPFFHLTFWGNLTIHLAGLLMTARFEHIRTPYTHSLDVWDALKSHGVDNYSDILTREKAMMLYQNIQYFRRNAGKQSNLNILTERLLSDLGIGVYGRYVIQQAEKQADDYQLTPQLASVRLPVKSSALPAPVEIKTVQLVQSQIFEKGLTDSRSSETVYTVERKLGDTRLNEYSTKFLEIRPISLNKPYAERLYGFLMETLILSISRGYYTNPVEITDPLTKESLYLSPKELLALYNYAVHKTMGITLTDFPDQVRLSRSFTTTIGTAAKTIPYTGGKLYISQVVRPDAYFADLHYDTNMQSPQDFTNQTTRLWLRYMDHTVAQEGTKIEKFKDAYSYLNSLCHSTRMEDISLVEDYPDYDSWLGENGLNVLTLLGQQYDLQLNKELQWGNLADAILTALIPVNDTFRFFGNFTFNNFGFERLRQLFVQLCSYRVVFLQSDREISEHYGTAQWLTAYGPDETHQYGDFIVPFNVNYHHTIDHVKSNHLLPGVTQSQINTTEGFDDYSVMPVSSVSQNSTTNEEVALRAGVTTTSHVTQVSSTVWPRSSPMMSSLLD